MRGIRGTGRRVESIDDIVVEDYSDITEEYLQKARYKTLFIAGVAVCVAILSLVTIRLGAADLSYSDILHTLLYRDDPLMTWTVYQWRLPVVIAAILCGCILALAGTVMQGILRNPMASPYTLGISNAAAFGAGLSMMFFGAGSAATQTVADPFSVTFCAFIFAMLSVGVTLLLLKAIDATPETIILAGIATGAVFSSGLSFMQYFADEATLSAIVFWQFGSLSKMSWNSIAAVLAVLIPAFVYLYWKRWDYNAMESGDDMARGLGVNTSRTRVAGLIVSALITAVVVSFMGIIGFVGLIGPHIVKRTIGSDYRYLLVGSMMVGAAVMLLSNIFAAHVFPMWVGSTLPVGIVTSAIGGPLFIAILVGRRGR